MNLSIIWPTALDSAHHKVQDANVFIRILEDESHPSHAVGHSYVESFCVGSHTIVVSFDCIPIRDLSCTVTRSAPSASGQIPGQRPLRLRYVIRSSCTTCTECHWATFSPAPERLSAVARIRLASHVGCSITGISFIIQLEDGSWLRNVGDKDFVVGRAHRDDPWCVEIPLQCPFQARFQENKAFSLYRQNPFWLSPRLGAQLHDIEDETIFVLASLRVEGEISKLSEEYVGILCSVDHDFEMRASLFSTGSYPAVRIETFGQRDYSLQDLQDFVVCQVGFGLDPFLLTERIVMTRASHIGGPSNRIRKIESDKWHLLKTSSAIFNGLGYCTWDAHGLEVSRDRVMQSLRWFSAQNIDFSYIIIDDGWQQNCQDCSQCERLQHAFGGSSQHRKACSRLPSFAANDKFPGSMENLSRRPIVVFAWITLLGYWHGINGNKCGVRTIRSRSTAPKGLKRRYAANVHLWENRFELAVPEESNLDQFFSRYFRSLAALGVNGVKVDGQSVLELFRTPGARRLRATEAYRIAMAQAAERAFPDEPVMNSMACGLATVLASGVSTSNANLCWRTSDDHKFPGFDETQDLVAWHILRNALNNVLLGEIFPVTDWDMFRASDSLGHMQAAARIASGGPIYVSDIDPFPSELATEALSLLRSLTTKSGKILRCEYPGRPTVDCLFQDPRTGPPKLFKIFNRNPVVGLIGIFNLRYKDSYNTRGSFAPRDIPDFNMMPEYVEYVSLVISKSSMNAFHHQSRFEECFLTVPAMSALLAHVAPIYQLPGRVRIAALGCPVLLNCGGGVSSISISKANLTPDAGWQIYVDIDAADSGETYIWIDVPTACSFDAITAGDGANITPRLVHIDGITFFAVNIPDTEPFKIRLTLCTA